MAFSEHPQAQLTRVLQRKATAIITCILTHPQNGKILFRAESLLETSPANPYGTVCILKHLLSTHSGLNSSKYCYLPVDYDIYWRLTFNSASFFKPSFPKCKKKLILILGPGYILYNLFAKIWKFFLPYLFTFLYFEWKNTNASV